MDYTKKHRESTHSLLMEKWGYGKMDEAIEGHDGKPCSEVHPDVTHLEFMNKLDETEELEEISLGGGGHSGGKSNIEGAPRKNKREEHIVNEVMNYLIKATRAGI